MVPDFLEPPRQEQVRRHSLFLTFSWEEVELPELVFGSQLVVQ